MQVGRYVDRYVVRKAYRYSDIQALRLSGMQVVR